MQNDYADSIHKPECKDKDFRTLVSWMRCVGADFADDLGRWARGLNLNGAAQYTSILRAATLGADGIWQLHISQHVWGTYVYNIVR